MRRVPRDVLVYLYRRGAAAPDLLMLRRPPDRGDFWHWISGAPQPEDTDREAAIREVLEETGLDVAATIFPLGYRYAYPRGGQRPSVSPPLAAIGSAHWRPRFSPL
jgi:8-oxo-dGTP pyrophosphatase MutT (NUDIX family)